MIIHLRYSAESSLMVAQPPKHSSEAAGTYHWQAGSSEGRTTATGSDSQLAAAVKNWGRSKFAKLINFAVTLASH